MKEKILIADDSEFMRKIIVDTVRKAGFFNLFEAENGRQVLDLYKKEKPDVILLDLIMPGTNGLDILGELADLGAKVIVISAIGQEIIIKKAFKIGAKGYFIKPFFVREKIGERIKMVLNGGNFIISEIEKNQLKKFKAISVHSSEKAAVALSVLVNEKVEVNNVQVCITDLASEIEEIKKKKKKYMITCGGFLKDMAGSSIFLISEVQAKKLVDILNGRVLGTTKKLASVLVCSTIEELLNILGNSYFTAMGDLSISMPACGIPKIIEKENVDKVLLNLLKSEDFPMPQKMVSFKAGLNIPKYGIVADLVFLFSEDFLLDEHK